MVLKIKNSETDRLVHELAEEAGETLTEAVTTAVRERLESLRRRSRRSGIHAEIAVLQAFVAILPDRDTRTAEEILGYDERGLPG